MLRVVDEERRQQHCSEIGSYLLERLHGLAAKHDIIGDVRGAGLMLGVELVKNRNTKVCAKLWLGQTGPEGQGRSLPDAL